MSETIRAPGRVKEVTSLSNPISGFSKRSGIVTRRAPSSRKA